MPAQVWKVVLQLTQVQKVLFNASTSAESCSATPAQVRKVILNTSTSAKSGLSTRTQVR